MMEEIWKDVLGYEGLYWVSSLGEIKSVYRPGKIKKQYIAKRGYLSTTLTSNGKTRTKTVHTIVAEAFLGPKPGPGYEVDHIDGDRFNNRADNLEWVTKRENYARMVRHQGQLAIYDKVRELEQRVMHLEKLLEDKDGER